MKTLIAIPALDWVYTAFMQSFLALEKGDAKLFVTHNSLIYDARNNISATAVYNEFDRVLWLDSDMVFDADMLERLHADMDEGRDFVAAYFTTRTPEMRPCIYKTLEYDEKSMTGKSEPYFDHPENVFEIAGCGFGAVLVKTDVLKRVIDKFGAPFLPFQKLGEDLSFCWRVNQCGIKMYCDGRIKIGHIGTVVFREGNDV